MLARERVTGTEATSCMAGAGTQGSLVYSSLEEEYS